jgi:hypothetical protein
MDGASRRSESVIYDSPFHPAAWKVAGIGDFNLDRVPDFFWRNASTGEMIAWFWTGASLGSATLTSPPALGDLAWTLDAFGDYDVDQPQDLVWRHSGSGQIVFWRMIGTSLAAGGFTTPAALEDVRWRIVGPR